jgi:hypothetical protein
MATIHQHRPSSPGYVKLDFTVLPSLLTDEEFAPIHELRAAYDAAQAAVASAHEALDHAKEAPGARRAAISRAVREGKRVPPEMSDAEAEARVTLATADLNNTLRSAKCAADEYEAALIASRPAIRQALAPLFKQADEEAAEAQRIAAEKSGRRSMILATFHTLDARTAEAADLGTGERTHRHRNALNAAQAQAGDPAAAVAVDLLESAEYQLARKGQAHYDAVRQARAELDAIHNGDRRFVDVASKVKALSEVQERLRGLGVPTTLNLA